MDRLIYTAYTGLSASMIQQRVIANNMANAQTTGFRAELLVQTQINGNFYRRLDPAASATGLIWTAQPPRRSGDVVRFPVRGSSIEHGPARSPARVTI